MNKYILKNFFSKSLYIWGEATLKYSNLITKNPTKLKGFDGLIEKASLGMNHGLFLTKNNELYSFGKNKFGQCGVDPNNGNRLDNPQKIDFFEKNSIIIKDIKVGKFHSLVLDDKGNVYSFGQGIRKMPFGLNYLFTSVCALGRKNINVINYTPKKLKLEKKITNIETGLNHCLALGEDKDIYVWGRGEYGTLGTSKNTDKAIPVINHLVKELAEAYETKVKKIRSIGSYSSILMENGKMYSFGCNTDHQMGNDLYLGLDIYESVNYPCEVKQKHFNDEKIVDFEIGERLSLFKSENNNFYFSGRKINLVPGLVDFNDKNEVKIFSCSNDGFAFVLNNNDIHFTGNFFNHNTGVEDIESGILKLENKFTEGNIASLGGGLNCSFALVEE